jgi:peptide/nickel transport system substrate-binding protein
MRRQRRAWIPLLIGLASLFAACAPSGTALVQNAGAVPDRATPKRVVAALAAEPVAMIGPLNPGAVTVQTKDVIRSVVHVGLTVLSDQGVRQPILVETLPSIDNGLWKVFPDGGMEITWKLRTNAVWQDGAPFTADDLVFSYGITQDSAFPEFQSSIFRLIDTMDASDPHTLVTRWSAVSFKADDLFATGIMPSHLLDTAYRERKDAFRQLPFWTTEFIGLGPYRIKQWLIGSSLLLSANHAYVLGRPKIDEIEVRFIPDANAIAANVLSGGWTSRSGPGLRWNKG